MKTYTELLSDDQWLLFSYQTSRSAQSCLPSYSFPKENINSFLPPGWHLPVAHLNDGPPKGFSCCKIIVHPDTCRVVGSWVFFRVFHVHDSWVIKSMKKCRVLQLEFESLARVPISANLPRSSCGNWEAFACGWCLLCLKQTSKKVPPKNNWTWIHSSKCPVKNFLQILFQVLLSFSSAEI